MILTPRGLRAATSNLLQLALYGHIADLRPMPAETVGDGPGGTVYRYRPPDGLVPAGPPVLFVPPPAAPARCYDLRRGCSLAEHVVRAGRRSYLLDPEPAREGGPDLGIGEWVQDVLSGAVRAVSADAGGQPVQLVGWCLGGIFALLTAAADPGLPIASVAAIAAPADARGVPPAPPPPRERAFGLAGIDTYLVRPYRTIINLDNADFLAQIEALDHFAGALMSYPGRAARQIYHALSRDGALLAGGIEINGRTVDLGAVGVPVLAIAGRGDPLAPVRAVRPLVRLLRGAPQVRFEVASGGHLDVLTGRSAKATTWRHLDRWLDEGIVRHGIRAQRAAATL
ncbi:alpha/beta fold hydrolase [Actinomadura madurae]|uniref:alpha/beta fold hydrolase n=1 Tax=Actinomadura madurae TaxID=1993 RepID=UPI000D838857|nr:alpha/beta fold hydrolase [Actinomadura madurae]SPT49683.1 acyl-CoA synthetase [Actinomadura madurae]